MGDGRRAIGGRSGRAIGRPRAPFIPVPGYGDGPLRLIGKGLAACSRTGSAVPRPEPFSVRRRRLWLIHQDRVAQITGFCQKDIRCPVILR
ncbi:hypothetical protein GCM10011612_05170 [Actinomyces gaoshouyii]|uniref:Uncharacterized protein n=1 Tax=Actinomyces gaoshouyii TaxID=1960083 RepID=A0A8H9HC58_9ACTO|nr:hypothetical protein GCM10011612_05170 [Actinomyces gaoshouyii]